jgi:hypothetical protein
MRAASRFNRTASTNLNIATVAPIRSAMVGEVMEHLIKDICFSSETTVKRGGRRAAMVC